MQREENSHNAQKEIDFLSAVWYADYVGVIIGMTLAFSYSVAAARLFVNLTMETFQNAVIIGYLISWRFFRPVI